MRRLIVNVCQRDKTELGAKCQIDQVRTVLGNVLYKRMYLVCTGSDRRIVNVQMEDVVFGVNRDVLSHVERSVILNYMIMIIIINIITLIKMRFGKSFSTFFAL